MKFHSFIILNFVVLAGVWIVGWWQDISDVDIKRIETLCLGLVFAFYWVVCAIKAIKQWSINRAMRILLLLNGDEKARAVAQYSKKWAYPTLFFVPLVAPVLLWWLIDQAHTLAPLFEKITPRLTQEDADKLASLQEAERSLLWGLAKTHYCDHWGRSEEAFLARGPYTGSDAQGAPTSITLFWCKYCLVKSKKERRLSVIVR